MRAILVLFGLLFSSMSFPTSHAQEQLQTDEIDSYLHCCEKAIYDLWMKAATYRVSGKEQHARQTEQLKVAVLELAHSGIRRSLKEAQSEDLRKALIEYHELFVEYIEYVGARSTPPGVAYRYGKEDYERRLNAKREMINVYRD